MEDDVRTTRRELLAGGALVIGGSLALSWRALTRTVSPWATQRVALNDATQAELRSVPGIGAASAAAIASQRPFASLDELQPLLGSSRLRRARPYLALGQRR
jgi:DNA uptake protein ComE-like DNA-binding protein